jgi:hypothetical protein
VCNLAFGTQFSLGWMLTAGESFAKSVVSCRSLQGRLNLERAAVSNA